MRRLRIGFLLPRYSHESKSQLVAAMHILRSAGVTVDVLHPIEQPRDLSQVRAEHDLYVLKKKDDLALSLAGALHALGATVVNPYPASVALRDKIIANRILQSAGVRTPATYVASRPEQLAALLADGPLIIKPYLGSSGKGIAIIQDADALARLPQPDKAPILAQRYHPPDGCDRKLYVIGGRVFGVLKCFPARTEAEKYGQPFTPAPELCEIAERCGRAFGIDLYGVDVVESEGTPYVVDMASIPGFKGVPDAPRLLAEYLQTLAARAAGGQMPRAVDTTGVAAAALLG